MRDDMDCKKAQQNIMPYIKRELGDRELEDFVEHIKTCHTCSEELEVYFTIYYALEKLDQDEQGSYNIQEMLEKDLEHAKQQIRKQNMLGFYRRFFLALVGIIIGIGIITMVQAGLTGGFENTTLYQLFHSESEEIPAPTTPIPTDSIQTTERSEPQTNRKNQVIVTIPETETITEPDVGTPVLMPN